MARDIQKGVDQYDRARLSRMAEERQALDDERREYIDKVDDQGTSSTDK